MFKSSLDKDEVGILAPIGVVMLPEALHLCAGAAFERKAGSPFLNCFLQFKKCGIYGSGSNCDDFS